MPAVLRKTLLASSGTLHNLCSAHGTSLFTKSSSSPPADSRRGHKLCNTQRRMHSQLNSGRGLYSAKAGDYPWPEASSATTSPSPYEIFGLKKGAPYSKRRFYELVKIYHPDRDGHDAPGVVSLPHAIRLQRYRLIIEANVILSDPAKKIAYDRYGAGWNGKADVTARKSDPRRAWSSFYDKESPARNATWEDWEQWYQRGQRAEQRPLYVSNGSFVALILLFAIIGSMHEMSRAGRLSRSLLQQLEATHDESSKALIRSRQESQGFASNDQRMRNFLKLRNPEAYLDQTTHEE